MYLASGGSWEMALEPKTVYTIGRSGLDPEVDLPFGPDSRLHRRCGELTVGEDVLEILNVGGWLPLTVTDVDGSGELRIDPARKRSVPFARFILSVDLGSVRHSIRFQSEQVERLLIPAGGLDAGNSTEALVSISRRAGYFKALVLLCSPKLQDPTSDVIPTDQQIASGLNALGCEPRRVTADIVERRLAYCRERLGLRNAATGAGAEDRGARRRLVAFVLNNLIVTMDDLRRLDHRTDP